MTCSNELAVLSGAGSSVGSEFEYIWTPLNSGEIVSGQGTLTPTVNAPGNYELTVINTTNGCQNISVQEVTSNDVFPLEAPPIPVVLNCDITEQILSSKGNAGFSYDWTTTAGGNIVGATNTADILIDAPGTYILNVTDDLNGCSTPYTINVEQDIEPPAVDAGQACLLYTSPSPRDATLSRMPSSA